MTKLTIFIITMLVAITCNAETIVRFSMQQGIIENTVDLKLYDTEKPITVTNFMTYVEDGSYNNSFIHRSMPGFIIQGGGYKYDPNIPTIVEGLSSVITNAPIENEPGISNLRGTIAMARPGDNVDGATSQWFFNLNDNSSILFPQDGGVDAYTVFGEVINNGMSVIDSISSIPIYDMGCSLFDCINDIPLLDYILGDTVFINNLVKITKVEGLVKISPDYDFGFVEPSTYQQSEFIIENIGTQNLSIGNIAITDPILSPFGINDTACNNTVLLPGASCVFIVSFNPVDINLFSDSFNIEFPVLGFDYTVNVSGVSVPGYDGDGDGVSDLIESSGSNNGDGNYDGILDRIQSNVVSIADSNGLYITLTGASNIKYSNVRFVDSAAVPNTPSNITANLDVLELTISGLDLNGAAKIGMILPASISPETFYIYGATDSSSQASWFDFFLDVNTGTGVDISGGTFILDDGSNVPATFATFYLKNAVRGDTDFNADNEIRVTGAFYGSTGGESSGQMYFVELCLLFWTIVIGRLRFHCK